MVQHLRKRVQHCGWQAVRADKVAYNWHREGNNAYLILHHFNMAHIEADKRMRQQPPISKPTPRVQGLTIPDPYQSSSETHQSATPSVTVTRVTQSVIEQHVPMAESSERSYTAAVTRGKRPPSVYPSTSMGTSGLPPPTQDNKRKNLSLLDPNYDQEDHQPPSGSLATPRPTYSPITPASIKEYLQPRTPGSPYLSENIDRFNNHLGDYAPAGQLARLSSNSETAMDCLNMIR